MREHIGTVQGGFHHVPVRAEGRIEEMKLRIGPLVFSGSASALLTLLSRARDEVGAAWEEAEEDDVEAK